MKRRTRQHVVGTYWEQKGLAWVEPREAELGLIDVPKTQLARPGDLVKVTLGLAEKVLRELPGAGVIVHTPLPASQPGSPGGMANAMVSCIAVALAAAMAPLMVRAAPPVGEMLIVA